MEEDTGHPKRTLQYSWRTTKTSIIATVSLRSINHEGEKRVQWSMLTEQRMWWNLKLTSSCQKELLLRKILKRLSTYKETSLLHKSKMESILSLKIHVALKGKLTVWKEQVANYIEIMSTMEKVVKTITKPFTINKSNETMKTDLQFKEK